MERRDFLIKAALASAAGLTGCARSELRELDEHAIAAGTRGSAPAGSLRAVSLTAGPLDLDLGDGSLFKVYGYNRVTPGPEIRVREGERLRVTLRNQLPEPTTIHWHGVPVPNGMDGVPGVTQAPVAPGDAFTYEFTAWPAGTYLYHSHAGYQLDQGLHGALIVEPRRQPGHDREFVLLLEDWATVDGAGPAASRAGRIDRQAGGMMGGGMMGGMMGRRRERSGEKGPLRQPTYDAYVINARTARAAEPLRVRKGDRVRLRLANPSASTTFLVRLAGHRLTVTHADGRPVERVQVDLLRLGMGERYDVEIIADNPGTWALVGGSEADGDYRLLRTLRYDGVVAGEPSMEAPAKQRTLTYSDLVALPEEGTPRVQGPVQRVFRLRLSGGMMGSPYWTINGERYPDTEVLTVGLGERVRLEYQNMSMMPHPMHLHGHFFELDVPGRPRKDTVLVDRMMGRMAVEFVADNAGTWFHHCHNLYHMEAGMANHVRVGEKA